MSSAPRWLWWAKRDLRLHDNEALRFVTDNDYSCLALYVFEPSMLAAPETSAFHALAQRDAVADLSLNIANRGGELLVTHDEVIATLDKLHKAYQFEGIVSHEESGSAITYERDKAVARWCMSHEVQWKEFTQSGVIRGLKSRNNRQAIIEDRLWNTAIRRPPRRIVPWGVDTQLLGEPMPDEANVLTWSSSECKPLSINAPGLLTTGRQVVSETQARADMREFYTERGLGYSGGISSPNSAFVCGSRLSTHLAWGTISLRTLFHKTADAMGHLANERGHNATQWRKSLRAFTSRLHWHDHFIQRLESAPSMEFTALNPAYAQLQYEQNPELLDKHLLAWRTGQTGIPMIDASVRCLMATGFLNFRMRAMLVTTACFGLKLPWQSLLHPLAQLFADYEPGIHISQIQMQAGVVGINTLRVYSPHKQLLDQDPQAIFVRQWIPELAEMDASTIANYTTQPLGDYPAPISDIAVNAKQIKDQLFAIRHSAEGRAAATDVLEKHGSKRVTKKRASVKSQKRHDNQMTLKF